MKLLGPKYYKKFKCIADKCKHSCCVGWEIDVDADTLEIYREIPGEIGSVIRESITERDGCACFKLSADEGCPHLDDRGLCRIIKTLGEDYLCDICREHPRFYNEVGDHTEVGLGAVCEEAVRLILDEPDYAALEYIDELYGDEIDAPDGFDVAAHRADLFGILSDTSASYTDRLDAIAEKYMLKKLPDTAAQSLFSSLEYLDEKHREMFASFITSLPERNEIFPLRERFFAYLIYRHASGAGNENEFRSAVFFALTLERLFAFLVEKYNLSPQDSARIISEELEYSEENTEAIRNSNQ